MLKIALGAALLGTALAECPNACSGHGTCGSYDSCTCYRLWQGNDCSMRSCPFDFAHVDSPKGDLDGDGSIAGPGQLVLEGSHVYASGTHEQYPGYPFNNRTADEAHYYQECSNKGICDRSTGECECFVGYEGSACQRTSCPNDCSGHGTCETIEELARDSYDQSDYNLWDRTHTRGCDCDPRWSGPDCSERQCDHGVDPLYLGTGTDSVREPTYEIIAFETNTMAGSLSGYFSLTFFDIFGTGGQKHTTEPLAHDASATDVAAALEALPNGVIPAGSITGASSATSTGAGADHGNQYYMMMTGNPGDLNDVVCDTSLLVSNRATSTCLVGQPFTGTGIGNSTCDIDLATMWLRDTDGSNSVTVYTNGSCPDDYNQHLVNEEVNIYNHLFTVTSWEGDKLTLSCDDYPESQELDGDHVSRCVEVNDVSNITTVPMNALVFHERAVVPYQQGTSVEYYTQLATTQMNENTVGSANTMRVDCSSSSGVCDFVTTYNLVADKPSIMNFGFGDLANSAAGLYNLEMNAMTMKIGGYVFTIKDISVVDEVTANVQMTTRPFNDIADKKGYKMVDSSITTTASNPSLYNTILANSGAPVFVTHATEGSTTIILNDGTDVTADNYIPVDPTTFKVLGVLYSVSPSNADTTATITPAWQGHSFDNGIITSAMDLAMEPKWGETAKEDYHPVLAFGLDSDAAVDTSSDGYQYVSECSNRGNCDTEAGVCDCFKGYSGGDCATVNALHV